ncbi:MAG: RNA 2',3'-cyclic phosphodiesterase [Planctomycetaceae bacterium]|nr:RNA 2',3'-cyclic phosphodiesterase [Planctomycetaceae bacterium]
MRTFLALDIDEAARRAIELARRQLDPPPAALRWVESENLHVTLNFLGEIGDEALHEVCDLVTDVAADHEPFDFTVRGISLEPRHKPHMFWIGVGEGAAAMAALQRDLTAALAGVGFRAETRAFRPHLTLARLKFVRHPRELVAHVLPFADAIFGACHADCVSVYTSELSSDGSKYTAIARAPLG